ncbi:ATP-binding cassette domain-containing protein [Candidatus Pelagisphaera phototrophica]|uniref:ATP-binding cassette domain-containing protein n=1 Tax=Candidatus Pelagisphaera phototrophica TaxID=2684113 RepID=UPI001A01F32C|nr:ABC transporter ATP-binding protein [Candidatus Pelagisphaera phototrophica]QXD33151.1 ABC transporter ATP-binding protein/permease [Candidatus Pelagisphaera phototrophica]
MKAEKTSPPKFSVLGIFKRVWLLMTLREQRRAGFVFFGIFINSFAEILGLAAVVPVIGLVIDPGLIHENDHLARAFEITSSIGIDTERKFLMFASIGLVAAFLSKAFLNLGLNLIQTRFSYAIGHRISGTMWKYHFSQSLERMRSTESGKVLTEIGSWPLGLANTYIVGSMRLLNELIVIFLIAVGLFAYNPIVLFSVSCLVAIGAIIIRKFTKRRLERYSEIRRALEPQTGTLINSAVRGFLDVMSFRASNAIRSDYLRKTKIIYRIAGNSQIMAAAPAKLYEVLAVTGLSGAILISLLLLERNEAFLNLLILMALSAYRVMPSMSRMNGQIMSMRGSMFILNTIEKALQEWELIKDLHQETQSPVWKSAVIRLNDVTIGYENLSQPVIANLTHDFQPGQIHAIVGPSGSGKSTLVNTILGLHSFSAGSISVGETTDSTQTLGGEIKIKDWLSQIGYLSQQPFLFNGSVRDVLTMRVQTDRINEERVQQLINVLELNDCLGENPLDFELLESGNNLSGGQQQRLAILRALRIDRPVLLLDEATSALDEAKRDAVFGLLRERAAIGVNVLLITHDMSIAVQCDTILNLSEG